jgi:hypothetical protein
LGDDYDTPEVRPDQDILSTAATTEVSASVEVAPNISTTSIETATVKVPYLIPFSSEEDLGLDVPDPGEQEHGAVTSVGLDHLASFARARTDVGMGTPSTVLENGAETTENSAFAIDPANDSLAHNTSAKPVPRKLPVDNEAMTSTDWFQGESSTLGPTPFPNLRSHKINVSVTGEHDSVEAQNGSNASSDSSLPASTSGDSQELIGRNGTTQSSLFLDASLVTETLGLIATNPRPNATGAKPGDEGSSDHETATAADLKQAQFLQRFGQLCHRNYAHVLDFSAFNATANKEWIAFLVRSLNEILQEQD